MPKKKNRYERIKDRSDKKRPYYVKEIRKMFSKADVQLGYVIRMTIISPEGNIMDLSWNEKDVGPR